MLSSNPIVVFKTMNLEASASADVSLFLIPLQMLSRFDRSMSLPLHSPLSNQGNSFDNDSSDPTMGRKMDFALCKWSILPFYFSIFLKVFQNFQPGKNTLNYASVKTNSVWSMFDKIYYFQNILLQLSIA